jgi:hypothetical protein
MFCFMHNTYSGMVELLVASSSFRRVVGFPYASNVKFTLEHAMKPRRWSRGIAVLLLGLDEILPPGKGPGKVCTGD